MKLHTKHLSPVSCHSVRLLASLRRKLFICLWLIQRRCLRSNITTLNAQAWRTGTNMERSQRSRTRGGTLTCHDDGEGGGGGVSCLIFSSSPSLKESWTQIYTAFRFQARKMALTHWASWPVCDLATCRPAVQLCRTGTWTATFWRHGEAWRHDSVSSSSSSSSSSGLNSPENTVGLLDPENELLRCFETSVTVH